jgi:hypothetical protein
LCPCSIIFPPRKVPNPRQFDLRLRLQPRSMCVPPPTVVQSPHCTSKGASPRRLLENEPRPGRRPRHKATPASSRFRHSRPFLPDRSDNRRQLNPSRDAPSDSRNLAWLRSISTSTLPSTSSGNPAGSMIRSPIVGWAARKRSGRKRARSNLAAAERAGFSRPERVE